MCWRLRRSTTFTRLNFGLSSNGESQKVVYFVPGMTIDCNSTTSRKNVHRMLCHWKRCNSCGSLSWSFLILKIMRQPKQQRTLSWQLQGPSIHNTFINTTRPQGRGVCGVLRWFYRGNQHIFGTKQQAYVWAGATNFLVYFCRFIRRHSSAHINCRCTPLTARWGIWHFYRLLVCPGLLCAPCGQKSWKAIGWIVAKVEVFLMEMVMMIWLVVVVEFRTFFYKIWHKGWSWWSPRPSWPSTWSGVGELLLSILWLLYQESGLYKRQ